MGLHTEFTAEELRKHLSYDPETGEFRRLIAHNRWAVGSVAGHLQFGYRLIRFMGRRYPAHRLAWLYMTGEWPKDQVDHRDLSRDNNRWANLREATQSQNQMNRPRMKPHRLKGTSFNGREKKFTAEIYKDRTRHFLGYFGTEAEAHQAYVSASRRLFGEFARAE